MTIFKHSVLLALIGIGAIASVSATADSPWLEITSLPLFRFPLSAHAETFQVVRSHDEWKALQTSQSNPSAALGSPFPIVDFAKYTLLLVSLGTKPSGGYTAIIRDARDDGEVIRVSVVEIRPGRTCATISTLTYPTTAALIPRTDKAVRFDIVSADMDCESLRRSAGS
jgi:hypothetical protein